MTYEPTFPCPRCGEDQGAFEVTMFGDPEPRYIQGKPCNCPGPRCPLCGARLQEDRCPTLDCAVFSHIVPVPDVR